MVTTAEDLVLEVPDGIYGGQHEWAGMVEEDVSALLAATFPAKPPLEWFKNPGLRAPTPLVVQSDGRVYGHIATFNTSHIGLAGGVKPPRSRSRYAFFATGALETQEGEHVNVGQLTLVGGHAPLEASVSEAIAHYDNTDSAWADVAVGEDKVGIWVAGALRPDVDEARLRAIRASSVSGDWRPINNHLELVAVCCVNVPGFPVPRARVASGATLALVAAGTDELVRASVLRRAGVDVEHEVQSGLSAVVERLSRVEGALLGQVERIRRSSDVDAAIEHAKAVTAAGEDAPADVISLRERVHSTIWDDGMPIEASIAQAMTAALRARVHVDAAAALRARVHPDAVVGTATSHWTADARKKAAASGVAMSDGSYPIKDCRDVTKAVRAMGRGSHSSAGIKRHIMKRARALGCKLPDAWKS